MARPPHLPSDVARHMGRRLAVAREDAQCTTEDVALTIGASSAYVQAVESGEASLTAEQVVELCRLLEVPPSWFFDGMPSVT